MEANDRMESFSTALDAYPARFCGNRLNLLFVDEAKPILTADQYLHRLDEPELMEERREYLLDEEHAWPFPCFYCSARPDPYALSDQLFHSFDQAADVLPTQRDIAGLIASHAREHDPAIVVLVIVDGLSYYDLPEETDAVPCLVDGITVTAYGYRQAVGRPSLSQRLFALGYTQQLGFTYFADSNDLASDLYDTFSESQRVRVRSFHDILGHIAQSPMTKGYVQITLSGLDLICHSHQDRPPKQHYLQILLDRYEQLLEHLRHKTRNALVCLTADHGILWREQIEGRLEVAADIFQEDVRSPRYIKGSLLRSYGRRCVCDGAHYTLLRYPFATRDFRNNEWGMHGGISAWESIVPLFVRST